MAGGPDGGGDVEELGSNCWKSVMGGLRTTRFNRTGERSRGMAIGAEQHVGMGAATGSMENLRRISPGSTGVAEEGELWKLTESWGWVFECSEM
jgi:hypothetical protein